MDMNNRTPIFFEYKKQLTDTEINNIFEIFSKQDSCEATLGDGRVDEVIRKTDIKWSNNQYLYDLFWPYMEHANNECWQLEVSAAENFQFGKYDIGGHYDYHIDGNMLDIINYNSEILNNKTRKISMVCWLNEDFEGGEFVLPEAKDTIITPQKGTIIFFPSFYSHKVKKVTKGTRYSLVNWFVGDRIR